jgi:hypothetical protein
MFSRVSRASTVALRKVRLAANRATDLLAERRWERRRLSTYQPLDEGEVTALLHRMGAPGLNEYAAQQRAAVRRRSFIPTDRDALITRIDTDFPWVRRQSLEAADRVREGRFDVLGSGIVDLRRDGRGGSSLDWNRDPRTGARYPERFSHWRAGRSDAASISPSWDRRTGSPETSGTQKRSPKRFWTFSNAIRRAAASSGRARWTSRFEPWAG